MDKDTKIKQLENEISTLRREFDKFKKDLNTEIINQQNTSRETFRSDKGEVILKKNFNLKSRKSLIPEFDNVTSMYFNEKESGKKNAIQIGHDGGNEKRFTTDMSSVVSTYDGSVASYLVYIDEVDESGNRLSTDPSKDVKLLITRINGAEQVALISRNSGTTGIGNEEDGIGAWTTINTNQNNIIIDFLSGKSLKINKYDSSLNHTEYTGVNHTGSVGGLEVVNGIVTGVNAGSGISYSGTISAIDVVDGIVTSVTP